MLLVMKKEKFQSGLNQARNNLEICDLTILLLVDNKYVASEWWFYLCFYNMNLLTNFIDEYRCTKCNQTSNSRFGHKFPLSINLTDC